MKECKWCNQTFNTSNKPRGWVANHSRWCGKNPNRIKYVECLIKTANNTITKEVIEGRNKKIKEAWERGSYASVDHSKCFKGKTHSKEVKAIMKKKALASTHRRLRKGIVKYKGVTLDSSWELALARRLDELQIKWIRPGPIKWIDSDGLEHNYFADFYLEKYNLYLDPKNKIAFEKQKEKVKILLETYNNIVFIKTLKECEEYLSTSG